MKYAELKDFLLSNADKKFSEFSKTLSNSDYLVIGVKNPVLRDLIKQHVKDEELKTEDFKIGEYLEVDFIYFGLSLARLKNIDDQFKFLEKNIRYAKSWAITDTVSTYLKKHDFEKYFDFFKKLYSSSHTYDRRITYVVGLKHYKDESILNVLPYISLNDDYMVMMAEAWLLATVVIQYPNEIYDFLKETQDITLKRKTISKINDSFRINEDIKKGTIDLAFTKPISYRIRLLSENLGNLLAVNLMIGLPGFLIAFIVFISIGYISVTPITLIISIAIFIVAQILANLLNDTISYICGVFCFYTSSGWGINQAREVIVNFLCGRLLPLSFFPGIVGTLVGYLPFAGISYYPVLILIGKVDLLTSLEYVGISLAWLVLLSIFAKLLFNHASKKITVQGG